MATVADVMSTELVTTGPETTLAEAATVMGTRRVGSALVFRDEELVGIFTERDMVRALSQDPDAARDPVSQWMTRGPISVKRLATVEEALELMLARGFRHLPVVEGESIVGIVSMRDLSGYAAGR